jgi:hypothetical protein
MEEYRVVEMEVKNRIRKDKRRFKRNWQTEETATSGPSLPTSNSGQRAEQLWR